MALTIAVSQFTVLTLEVEDKFGNPALYDGDPVFASSDETVMTVDSDGKLVAVAPGSARVTASIDADIGEGVKSIVGILEVSVVAGEATVVTLTAGPVENPAE